MNPARSTDIANPGPSNQKRIILDVNDHLYSLTVEARTALAEALRENLDLSGTKVDCNRAECGSCTVLIDGRAVYSCSMLAMSAIDQKILTIEGFGTGDKLDPLQQFFIDCDALQCGYRIPGIVAESIA